MKTKFKHNTVKKCGQYRRTIFRIEDKCFIGCFVGSREEAVKAIRLKHRNEKTADSYIDKVNELFDNDSVEEFNWKKYSWSVAEHCPEHFDSELFNWKKYSWSVALCCPEYSHLNPLTEGKQNENLLLRFLRQ